MKINWGPDRLNYEKIRQIADKFLEKYNPENIIPVDIEYIAEFDMNLTIAPLPNIELLLDVDSFISNDLKKSILMKIFINLNKEQDSQLLMKLDISFFMIPYLKK